MFKRTLIRYNPNKSSNKQIKFIFSNIKHLQASKESKMNSSDSNRESDLDLSKELLTISGYVNDKEAMIENMFKSISSKKMKTMLPEILQVNNLCILHDHIEIICNKAALIYSSTHQFNL